MVGISTEPPVSTISGETRRLILMEDMEVRGREGSCLVAGVFFACCADGWSSSDNSNKFSGGVVDVVAVSSIRTIYLVSGSLQS